jgi:hypothetical protein
LEKGREVAGSGVRTIPAGKTPWMWWVVGACRCLLLVKKNVEVNMRALCALCHDICSLCSAQAMLDGVYGGCGNKN